MSQWHRLGIPTTIPDGMDDIPEIHTVTVRGRYIKIDYPTLIQNNVKTDQVTLDLDGEWDGLSVLINLGDCPNPVSLVWTGSPVTIPAAVMADVGGVDVSVVGTSADGTTRLVTAAAGNAFTVIKSGCDSEGDVPEDPTSVLGQLIQAAENAEDAAESANSAASSANQAATSANSAATKANSAASNANAAASEAHSAAVEAIDAANKALSIGQYKGRDLATVFASEIAEHESIYAWLHSRVQDADFSGLRIGDYMDVPVSAGSNVPAQTVRYLLAAVDPYYKCSDQPMSHHLAFVPAAPVLVSGSKATNTSYIMWNTTATNNGNATVKEPYLASHLHGWEINDYLPALPAALRNVLINHRSLCEQRYGSSALTEASGWGWGDLGKVWSLSEMEVYGCAVWGSKGYSVGMDCHFPLFDSTASRIMGGNVAWWLRSVMGGSASGVCNVSGYGTAGHYAASYGWCRPRPCFLVG